MIPILTSPLSVVSGGLELRLEPEADEKKTGVAKLYDADDEEGESSEVILTRGSGAITEARTENGKIVQDLVLKRKRPNSLNRCCVTVSSQSRLQLFL